MAPRAHDIWAVGIQGGFFTHELIEHFDGTTWSAVPGPPVSARSHRGLDAVSADAPNDAWAVGSVGRGQNALGNELLHWNGAAWSVATPPNVNVAGITALSPTNVWAVGSSTSSSVASIAHFDGTSWSVVASPAPASSALNGIAAASAHDIWAVGQVGKATFTEHFDGTTWSVIASANPTSAPVDSNDLLAVTVSPDGGVVAVGSHTDATGGHPLIVQK